MMRGKKRKRRRSQDEIRERQLRVMYSKSLSRPLRVQRIPAVFCGYKGEKSLGGTELKKTRRGLAQSGRERMSSHDGIQLANRVEAKE